PYPAEGIPRHLLASLAQMPSRGDILANLVLYLPVGFFWSRLLSRRATSVQAASGAAVGAAISLGVEIAQVFDVGRVASLFDVALNTMSALAGAIFGSINLEAGGPRAPRRRIDDPAAAVLAA